MQNSLSAVRACALYGVALLYIFGTIAIAQPRLDLAPVSAPGREAVSPGARSNIDLNGDWEFRTDPDGVGDEEKWESASAAFPSRILVPGAWEAQGVGEQEGILRTHYSGIAWYRRSVSIPSTWQGKDIKLNVGGVVRRAVIFVNGCRMGEHYGFSTPFSIEITKCIKPGQQNLIVLRVANLGKTITGPGYEQTGDQPTGSMNYMGNWGGIYGNVWIEATESLHILETRITPDLSSSSARFLVAVRREDASSTGSATVEVNVENTKVAASVSFDASGNAVVQLTVPVAHARLWTTETPALYQATIRLTAKGVELDRTQERFGMREITTQGSVLLLNGKPLYLRGVGNDSYYVITGLPPASKKYFMDSLVKLKSFGFNAVRFHSTVPPREFFDAADEAGILILAELPAVYTVYFLPHKEFYWNEMERTLLFHWNHPSFLSLALGDELNRKWSQNEKEFVETVEKMYNHAKSIDPRRLILSNDGWLQKPTDLYSIYEGAPGDKPTIRHEFGGYYCSLPDVSLIEQFTGAYVPTWLEEKKKWVEEKGFTNTYSTYVQNSQRMQMLGRKFQIERVRRHPEITGYEYWLNLDYPGGTGEGDSWEEGWFDAFWRPKNIEPREGKAINSPVLLMIDADIDERTLWNGDRKPIGVWISNYGEIPIEDGSVEWQLVESGKIVTMGIVSGIKVGLGQVANVGEFDLSTPARAQGQKLELILTLKTAGHNYVNSWAFWSYPRNSSLRHSPIPVVSLVRSAKLKQLYPFLETHRRTNSDEGLLITTQLDQEAKRYLESGGRVWLMADREQFNRSGEVSFFPSHGGAQGTLVLKHPSLVGFPHDGLFDAQFYNLMEGSWWFSLDDWPKEIVPIASAIHTTSEWLSKTKNLSRAGFIVEAKTGKGKLLITAFDFRSKLDDSYPEVLFLFDQLLRYATSEAFTPNVEVPSGILDSLLRE